MNVRPRNQAAKATSKAMLSATWADTRDRPPGENPTANEIAVYTFVQMAVQTSNFAAEYTGNFNWRSQAEIHKQLTNRP